MRHALERVLDRVREIVHRIDAPLLAQMVVRHVADAVEDGIAEVDVGRGHVDLGPEAPFAVRVLARAHLAEDLQVALGRRVARGRGGAGAFGNAAVGLPLVLRKVAAVRLAGLDEVLGDLVHAVEHVGGVVEAGLLPVSLAAPAEPQPADVLLDVLRVLVGLLCRIRVVEPQMALSAEELGHSEVYENSLCVPDVYVAVGLRGKARDHLAARATLGHALFDPLPEKMPGCI